MLKNEDNILPLASSKNAKNGRRNSAKTAPSSIAILGNGAGPSSKGLNGCEYQSCDDGVLGMGWGSGSGTYPYLITPLDAITARAAEDGTTVTSSLSDSDTDRAAEIAAAADVAIVFISCEPALGFAFSATSRVLQRTLGRDTSLLKEMLVTETT